MTDDDIARVIFANLFPRGMCPADWDSGAILGPDNCVREQFLTAARALLSASIADTAGAKPVAVDCAVCGGTGDVSGEYPGEACHACGGSGKALLAAPPAPSVAEAAGASEHEALTLDMVRDAAFQAGLTLTTWDRLRFELNEAIAKEKQG